MVARPGVPLGKKTPLERQASGILSLRRRERIAHRRAGERKRALVVLGFTNYADDSVIRGPELRKCGRR